MKRSQASGPAGQPQHPPASGTAAPQQGTAGAPAASGACRGIAAKTVDRKRRRLEQLLKKALEAKDPVEALAVQADEFVQQELASDSAVAPALQYMRTFGVPTAAVWQAFLAQFKGQLAEALRQSPREVVEKVLWEFMVQAQGPSLPAVCDFIVVVLQRLTALPPASDREREAIGMLVDAVESGKVPLSQLPAAIHKRLWEKRPATFFEKAAPLVRSFLDLMQLQPGPLRLPFSSEEASVVASILDLIGGQKELYVLLRDELLKGVALTVKSDAEEAIAEEAKYNAYLSTLRSSILVELVNRKVLAASPVGTWRVKAGFSGRSGSTEYFLTLHQNQGGQAFGGRSSLEGVQSVEWSLEQGGRLNIRQIVAEDIAYICSCNISQDYCELVGGSWRTESSRRTAKVFDMQGAFSATRASLIDYVDAAGQVWDEGTHVVHLLANLAGSSGPATFDKASARKMQKAAQRLLLSQRRAQRQVAKAEVEDGGAAALRTAQSVGFAFADPCVSHALWRTFVRPRSEQSQGSGSEAEVDTIGTVLVMCCGRCIVDRAEEMEDRKLLDRWQRAAKAFMSMSEQPFTSETLMKNGIHCDWLLEPLRKRDLEVCVNAILDVACQSKGTEDVKGAQTLLAPMACDLFKQRPLLQTCMDKAARGLAAVPAGQELQWVHKHLMYLLVHTGFQLGESFDVHLRKIVTTFIFEAGRKDPWAHWYIVVHFLGAYGKRFFVSTREETETLTLLLEQGKIEDSRRDWSAELAEAYNAYVQVKSYLRAIFACSNLGKLSERRLLAGH